VHDQPPRLPRGEAFSPHFLGFLSKKRRLAAPLRGISKAWQTI
jgi:hypothetical protein